MRTVRHVGAAQQFRPYTGPASPAFSEAKALARGRLPGDYSLGRWDVGMVHEDGRVDWTPAWIIASEHYVEDMSWSCLGEPCPDNKHPGWVRDVVMYDVRSGHDFLGYSF